MKISKAAVMVTPTDPQKTVWGERRVIRSDSSHELSVLTVLPGTRCSWHRHQCKYNLFVVLSGRVDIVAEVLVPGSDKVERKTYRLMPGESLIVAPGVWHEFRGYEQTEMVEDMYVLYDADDIDRDVVGGTFDLIPGADNG